MKFEIWLLLLEKSYKFNDFYEYFSERMIVMKLRMIEKRITAIAASAVMALGMSAALPASSVPVKASAESAPTPAQVVKEMGLGWNLGNTLDSTLTTWNGSENVEVTNTLATETGWGNPRATANTFRAVKAKGFSSVRIPVTWSNHVDADYTIDEEWLDRVHDVVDYALDEGLYVILNSHHDDYNDPSGDLNTAQSVMTTLWTQIANEFRDYDHHLIFEGMNEPRTYNDNNNQWWTNNYTYLNNINQLNKTFVETVRSTGGSNSTRMLMLPDYAASSSSDLMAAWQNLSGDKNIIVSVHAYSPYDFAMGAYHGRQFTDSDKSSLDGLFNSIDSLFLSNGYSVCIGEFGASDWNNQSARVQWAEYYAGKVTELRNKYSDASISAVLWDNNGVGSDDSEYYYYLNRDDFTWYSQNEPVVSALVKKFGGSETAFTPEYDRDGYVELQGSGWWSETTIGRAALLRGYDESEVESVTVSSTYRFIVFIGDSQINDVVERTLTLDEIGDGLRVGVSYNDDKVKTIEWKVNLKESGSESVVNAAQVIFGGSFGLRYYFTPSEDILADSGAYITINKANKDEVRVKLSDITGRKDSMYYYQYNVVAKEICDNITFRLFFSDGTQAPLVTSKGVDCTESGFIYSVKAYAQAVEGTAELSKYHALAQAMIDYGNGVQLGLGYSSEDNPAPSVSDSVKYMDISGLEAYAHVKTGENSDYGLTSVGPNVIYLDKSNYRVNFTFAQSTDLSGLTFTVDGARVTPKNSAGSTSAKSWYVEIPDIQGKSFDEMYTVALTKEGSGLTPLTLKAGALSYARLLTQQTSESYKLMGRVMYNYYLAEKAVFG